MIVCVPWIAVTYHMNPFILLPIPPSVSVIWCASSVSMSVFQQGHVAWCKLQKPPVTQQTHVTAQTHYGLPGHFSALQRRRMEASVSLYTQNAPLVTFQPTFPRLLAAPEYGQCLSSSNPDRTPEVSHFDKSPSRLGPITIIRWEIREHMAR